MSRRCYKQDKGYCKYKKKSTTSDATHDPNLPSQDAVLKSSTISGSYMIIRGIILEERATFEPTDIDKVPAAREANA